MNQTLPFFQFTNPNTFFNQQPQMNQFNIEQLKSKYVQQNQPTNSFYNKAFTMNPSTNPNNFFFGLQDNMRYNQNLMNTFNTMNNPNLIPQVQKMNQINNNNMLINPRDEIERIKMKYFSIENANKTNEFKNTLSTIEDKIQKYKEQIYSSPNDPISTKYNISKPVTVNEQSKPSFNQKFEINRVNDIEINTNENNNDLLLSKMSWIEGKISTSSNKFNFNNNSINMLEANKNNDITTNNQNVSYTYSNSCKSEKDEKEDNYNYDEVLPIIDKVSKLKEIENITEEEHYHTEEEEEDHKSLSKQIVNNVIDEVSSKLSEKSQKEEEENKVDYLNVKDLEVHNVNTNRKKEISQPKVIISNKKQATLPKKKLISFEEFLSLNDE